MTATAQRALDPPAVPLADVDPLPSDAPVVTPGRLEFMVFPPMLDVVAPAIPGWDGASQAVPD